MLKVNDWVRHKEKNLKGKIIAIYEHSVFKYRVIWQNKKIGIYTLHELQRYAYTHKEFTIGIFRFSFFKLGKKWTLRLEFSKGWE